MLWKERGWYKDGQQKPASHNPNIERKQVESAKEMDDKILNVIKIIKSFYPTP